MSLETFHINREIFRLRKVREVAADSVYKDLRMLVEERDRCLHALEMLPQDATNLSFDTARYQTVRYLPDIQ